MASQPRTKTAPQATNLQFGQAINAATRQAMELDPRVFVLGQSVFGKSGVFGTTTGLIEKFGPGRVLETPVSESAMTAIAAGAANAGLRPVMVHQRLDFMIYSMDQITNWISLWRFKSAGQSTMPITIRAIVGKGWGQGPQHAKSLHTWFAHLPGLQVVLPSSPTEAKGLLLASIFSDDPTIFIEGRSLYSAQEEVPDEPYFIQLGKAAIRRSGQHATVVSFGSMIPAVLQAAGDLASEGIEIEVVDLRTVSPLDSDTVLHSVEKTRRLLVVEPGWEAFGVAAEVVARVCEQLGPDLKSPPRRVAWPNSHVPMSAPLEAAYYPTAAKIKESLRLVLQ